MRIKANQVAQCLASPPDGVYVFLCYGPNHGLALERFDQLARLLCDDPDDPFKASDLSAGAIGADPAVLATQLQSQSFFGTKRIVRVRDAADVLTRALKTVLEEQYDAGYLLLCAGDLSPRSSLRSLCEGNDRAAAIACYAEEGQQLTKLIQSILARNDITIARDALHFVQAQMGNDRSEVRLLVEKLCLYCGSGGRVDLPMAQRVIAQAGSGGVDEVLAQAFCGKVAALDQGLTRFFQEGGAAISLCRAACNHVLRLLHCRRAMQSGMSAREAMGQLRPRVFFKLERGFEQQLRLWPYADLLQQLQMLMECERQCKQLYAHDGLLAQRQLLQIAAMAYRTQRQGRDGL